MAQREGRNAATEKQRAVENRGCDHKGEGAHSWHALFKHGDPAPESHFRAHIEEEEQKKRNGARQAKKGKPMRQRVSGARTVHRGRRSTHGEMKSDENE